MKHIVKINKIPVLSGKQSIPDGAINGNGDLSVILGTYQQGLRIFLSKIDIWEAVQSRSTGGLRPLGYIDIEMDAKLLDDFYCEQDMDRGEIRCRFGNETNSLQLNIRVHKGANFVMLEKNGDNDIYPCIQTFEDAKTGKKDKFIENEIQMIFRGFDDENCLYNTYSYCGLKKVCSNVWIAFAMTNHDNSGDSIDGLKEQVISKLNNVSLDNYKLMLDEHYELWKLFWEKSSFNVSDESLELNWYASQYFLACCAGNQKFPPGLFGNFVTVENPSWHSDYHLNYNYQAPFYAACSSNHVELTDCYHAPLEDFLDIGKGFAEKFNAKGILYPVGIGPKGIYTEYQENLPHWFERLFLGQKNNQIHPANIIVFRWNATKDLKYAKDHAYPYIKACLEFFESYAVKEGNRYSICDDAVHEVPMYRETYDPKKREYRYIHDKNNIVTLGLLRLCIPAAIEMAQKLNVDEDKCEIWQDLLCNLSPFPTTIRWFKKVFRYCEKGQRWHKDNDVGLQHIYPGCNIGLLSDKKQLKIARNTFNQRRRICKFDDNAISSYYPMAARLGINPRWIIKYLKKQYEKNQLPNLLLNYAGGGVEYCSTTASTLNEMVLQSYQGTILLFPCWDYRINCSFKSLRADGGYLVSSSIKDGVIGETTIVCENSGLLKIKSPYKSVVIKHGNRKYISSEELLVIDSKPNDIIVITK